MAPLPLPLADPDATALLNSLLSSISSLFKSKPSRRPIFSTSPEGIDSIELKDWVTPSLLPSPSPPPQTAPSEPPTRWELKPPGPEKVPLLEIPGLQNTDEYRELVSNRWNYIRKRTVQDQEHPAMVRAPEGEYHLSYSQELSLVIFLFLVTVFVGNAAMSAMAKIERKLRHRLTHCLGELGEDQRMYAALYCVVYGAIIVGLWIILLFGVFGFQQLLQVAIWG